MLKDLLGFVWARKFKQDPLAKAQLATARGDHGEAPAPDICDDDYQEGVRQLDGEQWQGAARSFQAYLARNPDSAIGHYKLGVVLQSNGDWNGALSSYTSSLRIDAGQAQAHNNMACIYQQLNLGQDAENHYLKAIELDPRLVQARRNFARLLLDRGRARDAVEQYLVAASLSVDDADLLNDLGSAYAESGDIIQAEANYRAALEINPELNGSWNNLANVLRAQGRVGEAVECYQKALAIDPSLPGVAYNLAGAYLESGDVELSASINQAIVGAEPNHADAHLNLGNALRQLGRPDEALDSYKKAVALSPEKAGIYSNLGNAYRDMGQFQLAKESYLEAVRLDPVCAGAYSNLAALLQDQGEIQEAIQFYRKAIDIDPGLIEPSSNLLLCLHYHQAEDREFLLREHLDWADRFGYDRDDRVARDAINDKRRLRVGFISGDFRCHSVSYFLLAYIENYSREKFEIYCYATSGVEDEVTFRIQKQVSRWRNVTGIDDAQFRTRIIEDQIDILVDLSGHTAGSRVRVLSNRCAPVQATYLGYPDTTGIASIDYRIVDDITDPADLQADAYSVETLYRISPPFLCYVPPDNVPDISDLPAKTANSVNFVCFNNYAKVSPQVLGLWAKLLDRIPGSRLILKSLALRDEAIKGRVLDRFCRHGIQPDRIMLLPRTSTTTEHLSQYSLGDVALDTFPYSGTTTTCEALLMGLPVITLRGASHVSRVSASLLHALGKDEWVADSEVEYVDKAVALCGDLTKLAESRCALRKAVLESPLCDKIAYAQKLELAFSAMWEKACAGKRPGDLRQARANAKPVRLHIGGKEPRRGWKILNISPGENTDIVADCADLSMIESGSVDVIYASHVLEHLGYVESLPGALREWWRVLKKDGLLRISVPDMDILAAMFVDLNLSREERYHVMRMMFGGQMDSHDFHHVGLNMEILSNFLSQAGFNAIERIHSHDLFNDTSMTVFKGRLISLNVVARK